jgi:hypothetical protein
MYILTLDKGYALIEQRTKKDGTDAYYLADYENGTAEKIRVGRTEKSVCIIPTGQIVIDQFNNSWERYKASGGKRDKALSHKKFLLSTGRAACPSWIYPEEPPTAFDLHDIDLIQDRFIKTAFIPYNGTLTPVFDVQNVSELYFYDLFRLKTEGIPLAQCTHCGRAYRKVTTRKYCDKCSSEGVSQRKKQENLKSDIWSSTYKKIRDRGLKDKDKEYIYSGYNAELLKHIDEHRNTCRTDSHFQNGKDYPYITEINLLDKAYRKLCKHNNIYLYDSDWKVRRELFLTADNPAEWLKQEYKNAGLQFPAE